MASHLPIDWYLDLGCTHEIAWLGHLNVEVQCRGEVSVGRAKELEARCCMQINICCDVAVPILFLFETSGSLDSN